MRTVWTLAKKDLLLLVRDRFGMFWVLVFPLLQATFFGAIFSGQGRGAGQISIAVVDEDRSEESRGLIERLKKSKSLTVFESNRESAATDVRRGKRVAYVAIRKGFGESSRIFMPASAELEVGIDPSRQAEAGYLQGLLMEASFGGIQQTFANPEKMQAQIRKSAEEVAAADDIPASQKAIFQFFFGAMEQFVTKLDPELFKQGAAIAPAKIESVAVRREGRSPRSSFEITFPAAMLWGVIGCTAGFAVSLVTERKSGTLLRLRVAPLTRRDVLAGKAVACCMACVGIIVLLIVLGRLVFGVRVDRPGMLAIAATCTALCFVGLSMFISVLGRSEQGVAGASWALLLICAMLGGGMVPLIAMPGWMLRMSSVSPVKWGVYALEGAIWRDFSPAEMAMPCAILLAVGAVLFSLGVAINRRIDR